MSGATFRRDPTGSDEARQPYLFISHCFRHETETFWTRRPIGTPRPEPRGVLVRRPGSLFTNRNRIRPPKPANAHARDTTDTVIAIRRTVEFRSFQSLFYHAFFFLMSMVFDVFLVMSNTNRLSLDPRREPAADRRRR